jgi:putative intracellular protease/amidase
LIYRFFKPNLTFDLEISSGERGTMNQRILFVLTSHDDLGGVRKTGFYVPEAANPWKVFSTRGFEVDFVSPKGGQPPMDGFKADDPDQVAFLKNPTVKIKLQNTLRPDQVEVAKYDAIFYVGGHGTMWDFADNADLQRITAAIYEAGGVVSAVCHGPAGLVNVKLRSGAYLVAGKTVATFTDAEERAVNLHNTVPFMLESRLLERGARVVTAPNFQSNVQVDGRLVTGQNPASASDVANAVVRVLEAEPVATD